MQQVADVTNCGIAGVAKCERLRQDHGEYQGETIAVPCNLLRIQRTSLSSHYHHGERRLGLLGVSASRRYVMRVAKIWPVAVIRPS